MHPQGRRDPLEVHARPSREPSLAAARSERIERNMRALASVSLIALAVACAPREKVIVIKEPSGPTAANEKNAQPPSPGSNPIAAETPRSTSDEPDWGIKDPSDGREYARV